MPFNTFYNRKKYPMQSIEARSKVLREILEDSKKMKDGLDPFLQEIDQLNIETAYLLVGQLSKNLTKQTSPILKINSLSAACKLLEEANYPIVILTEIYLTPCLKNVLDFVVNKADFRHFTLFFQEEGYNQSIPYLQNLSYNFVNLACQFIQLAAFVKPLKIYEGREYSDSSLFRRQIEQMTKRGFKHENIQSTYKSRDLDNFREKFIHSLSRWSEYEDRLLIFFVQIFEIYLNSGTEPVQYGISIIDTLKYGQPVITSEIIARLADVIAYNQNFKIRSRALKLFDNFILWGDIEALLVVNYGDQLQMVIQNFWSVEGQKSLDAGRFIYPEIEGQLQEKYEFYINFLRCFQTWSQTYPTKEYYSDNSQQSQEHSVIYQLYRLMKDKKRYIFPSNLMILKFQKESHKNMRDKLIRNQMILTDINQNEESVDESVKIMTLQEVQSYYEIHKEYLLEILNKDEDYLYQNIKKVLQFKENFENYAEKMNTEDESDENIDTLIENGLELIDLINAIHIPYIEFLKQEYTYPQFKDIITNICFEYFHPQKKQSKMRIILSQRLKVKKEQLKSLIKYQKSIPLWKQLQQIFNNVNFKELKSKYKNRIDRLHSSKSSEVSSSISLQIYTKTKFTKESREVRMMANKHPLIKSKDNSIEMMKSEQGNRRSKDFSAQNNSQRQSKKSCRENKSKIVMVRPPVQKNNKKNQLSHQPERELKDSGNLLKTVEQQQDTKHERDISTCTTLQKQNEHEKQDKIQSPCQFHFIPFEENKQYFTHLDYEQFKFSYVYAHIVIFKSSYLTAERVVSQLPEGNNIKVQVQIILYPIQPLYKLSYKFQNQECIQIEDRSDNIPQLLQPYTRYILTIVGTMRKIPLKLPTVLLSINSYPIFQYILPFTINFFLPSCPSQSQVLHSYGVLVRQAYNCFISRSFKCSETLFPNKDINNILIYFPFSLKIGGEPGKEIFLWQVKDRMSIFFVVFQYEHIEEELTVKIYCSAAYDESYHSLFSFILNCLAHILAQADSK